MGKSNSSTNGSKHPYMRVEAWTKGIQGRAPLSETWLKRTTKSIGKDISPAEWMANWLHQLEKENKNPQDEIKRRYV